MRVATEIRQRGTLDVLHVPHVDVKYLDVPLAGFCLRRLRLAPRKNLRAIFV